MASGRMPKSIMSVPRPRNPDSRWSTELAGHDSRSAEQSGEGQQAAQAQPQLQAGQVVGTARCTSRYNDRCPVWFVQNSALYEAGARHRPN